MIYISERLFSLSGYRFKNYPAGYANGWLVCVLATFGHEFALCLDDDIGAMVLLLIIAPITILFIPTGQPSFVSQGLLRTVFHARACLR